MRHGGCGWRYNVPGWLAFWFSDLPPCHCLSVHLPAGSSVFNRQATGRRSCILPLSTALAHLAAALVCCLQSDAVIVDIRGLREKEAGGIPEIPNTGGWVGGWLSGWVSCVRWKREQMEGMGVSHHHFHLAWAYSHSLHLQHPVDS